MKKDWTVHEPRSGWEQAEDDHLRLGLAMSFSERLAWIEEAARVATHLARARPAAMSAGGNQTSSQPRAR